MGFTSKGLNLTLFFELFIPIWYKRENLQEHIDIFKKFEYHNKDNTHYPRIHEQINTYTKGMLAQINKQDLSEIGKHNLWFHGNGPEDWTSLFFSPSGRLS